MCNEPGREGGLVPTKTDDVYILYLSHLPQTQSINIIIVIQLQYNCSLYYGSQKPTSAARTEVHSMIGCQANNKPGWVRGKPAPAAPSPLDRTAHLVYMLVNVEGFPAGLPVRKAL